MLATNDMDRICKCPTRTKPLDPPSAIPYALTEENVPKLKKWISDHYTSSVFNTCTHQFLPLVESSPLLWLLVDPTAVPKAIHKPAQVPIHFRDKVEAGLKKDVRLGVIEHVWRTPQQHGVAECVS